MITKRLMKKNGHSYSQKQNIITEESYHHIVIEIINDVIEKRKKIHSKYDELTKKLLVSKKETSKKSLLAKYIMSRVLKESDRAFADAQLLAKQLCPVCKKSFSSYEHNSEKYH